MMGGGDVQWNFELHRAIWQAFRTVGSDPENEVLILTTMRRSISRVAASQSFLFRMG
jgi:hypothetical protein